MAYPPHYDQRTKFGGLVRVFLDGRPPLVIERDFGLLPLPQDDLCDEATHEKIKAWLYARVEAFVGGY